MGHYPRREGIVNVPEIRDIFGHVLLVVRLAGPQGGQGSDWPPPPGIGGELLHVSGSPGLPAAFPNF